MGCSDSCRLVRIMMALHFKVTSQCYNHELKRVMCISIYTQDVCRAYKNIDETKRCFYNVGYHQITRSVCQDEAISHLATYVVAYLVHLYWYYLGPHVDTWSARYGTRSFHQTALFTYGTATAKWWQGYTDGNERRAINRTPLKWRQRPTTTNDNKTVVEDSRSVDHDEWRTVLPVMLSVYNIINAKIDREREIYWMEEKGWESENDFYHSTITSSPPLHSARAWVDKRSDCGSADSGRQYWERFSVRSFRVMWSIDKYIIT